MEKEKNSFKLDVVSIRLVKDAPICSGHPITMPIHAVELVGKELCDMDREVVCVINLKSDGTPINCSFVSVGVVNEAVAHPREMLKSSILSNAANIIIVHNHPSGSIEPSQTDTALTDRMAKICEFIGIPLVDHVIVGGDNSHYFSFKEKKIMPIPQIYLQTDYKNLDIPSPMVAEKGRGR